MAGSIKGITIEIYGKTDNLVKSLSNVNKSLKDTQGQLKTVNEALKLNPNNVELLATKQDLLNTAIEQTKEKLALEKQAAADAAVALEKGTITKNEYNALQAAVAKTTGELAGLEKESQSTAANMDNLGNETEQASEQAGNAGANFEKFGQMAAAAATVAATSIAAVTAAATAAAKALIDCALGGAEFADEILTMSSVTGVSAETLQEWSYAAELVDVSVDTMASALQRTTRQMNDASDGSGTAAEAFAQLGISVTDANGNLRDNEDVFWETIDALGQIDNATERDALAMELLGRSATELNPLIEAGSAGMAAYAEEAHEAGYVLSDDTLGAFGDLDDQLQRLSSGTTAAKNALGTVLLPVLSRLAGDGVDFLGQFTNAILATDGDVEQMGEVFGEMIPQAIDTITSYLPMLLVLAGTIIEALSNGIIDNLDVILSTAVDIILSICNGILSALPKLIPTIVNLIMTIVNAILNNLPAIIDAAIQIIIAVANGLTEALPQLIPVTYLVITQIVEGLLDNIPELVVCAIDLMVALAQGLVNAIPEIVTRVPEIIMAIVGAFADLGVQLAENASRWGTDMIDGLVNSIRNSISNVSGAAADIAGAIAQYIHFSRPDKGPLHDYETFMPDMIEGLSAGIEDNMYKIEASVGDMALTMGEGINSVDYSGALGDISGQLSTMAGNGQPINVYIGNERLGTAIARSNSRMALISGGM